VDSAGRRGRPQIHQWVVTAVPVNPSLLDILCCPAVHGGSACHGRLVDLGDGLLCKSCGLIYPIENGIPVLLADHARKGDDGERE